MQSILSKLYCGQIHPEESLCPTPEIHESEKLAEEAENDLVKTLSPEQEKLFEEFMMCKLKARFLLEEQIFSEGFKIATSIMLEVMFK